MKLSQPQLIQIRETLESHDVVYEDVITELVDHIASQVESILIKEPIGFDLALKVAFEEWEIGLREVSDGFWVPRKVTGPKLIMDRWVSYSKKHFVYILILSVCLTMPIVGFIHLQNTDARLEAFEIVIRTVFGINIILVIASRIVIWRQKYPTTAGYLFKRRSLQVFFMPIMILLGFIPTTILHNPIAIQFAMAFFFVAFNLYFLLDYPLVMQHLQINKKLTSL